ncbi:hypothetical protein ACTU3M_10490 [Bacillus subtilis]|uniref:hypothetical protein n=1 Tax=Bacillus subtilis TaxID=1423 RepID=UPI003FCC83D1
MKKFNKMVINKSKEVVSEGYYERYNNELIIEASDLKTEREFWNMFCNNVIISNIEFEDSESSSGGGFNGPYFIRSIHGDEITLQK